MIYQMWRTTLITCFTALCALTAIAHAEPPDWTGFYMVARGPDLAGLHVVSQDLNKTVVDHLQPWAKLKMESTNGAADDTGAVCLATGILRAPGTPFSSAFSVLPSRDKIIMPYWEISIPKTLPPAGTAIRSGIGRETHWWSTRSVSTISPGLAAT
jgi:hypothetical protein